MAPDPRGSGQSLSLVIDASVVLKWILEEPDSDKAWDLRSAHLFAPSLWRWEVGSALWKRARRGDLTVEDAESRLRRLRRAPIETIPIEEDGESALALAFQLGHPVYDCLYLALAIRKQCDVITADRRFHAAVARAPELSGRVRLLAT